MLVRCLHCHEPIELPDEGDLSHVNCSACGGSFSLVGRSTLSYGDSPTRKLAQFVLLEELGTGAFGTVWKARDTRLDRLVAIKVPRAGHLGARDAEMFLREARAAAQLRHPGIVPIHEIGCEGDTLYIVSDYVEGATLDDWLTCRRLTPREAAQLCLGLAEALDHAHQQGVIHRDLKPGNIMLDLSGCTHILDFGLARRSGREATMTFEGRVLGTPAYMSPEQARGEGHMADQRSDIYSLGVILYRLLTGELPFRGSLKMIFIQIQQDDPPSPRRLASHVPRDLETICLKCLEKAPDKRYPTARALAGDLQHYLAGEPIGARPVGRIGRGWRWCKRKPVIASLSALVLVLLMVISVAAPWAALYQAQLRGQADEEAERRRRLLYVADMAVAREALESGDLVRLESLLRAHVPHEGEADLRGFEWRYLWRQWKATADAPFIQLDSSRIRVNDIDVSADGSRILMINAALGSACAGVTLVDVPQRKELGSFGGCQSRSVGGNIPFANVPSGAIAPDGRTIAYTEATLKIAVVENLDTGRKDPIENDSPVFGLRFSPGGESLLIAFEDGSLRFWSLAARRFTSQLPGKHKAIVAWSPDGSVFFCAGDKGTLEAWNLADPKQLWSVQELQHDVLDLAVSPGGEYIASGGSDTTVIVRDAQTGVRLRTLIGARDDVRSVAFSRDGELLAAGSRDHNIRLWALPDFSPRGVIRGYNMFRGLAFLPDGRLAFGGDGGRIVLRQLPAGGYNNILPCFDDQQIIGVALSHHGDVLVVSGKEKCEILLWKLDPAGSRPLQPWILEHPPEAIALSSSDMLAVADTAAGAVILLDLASRREVRRLPVSLSRKPAFLAFSPRGAQLALGCRDGSVLVFDVSSGETNFDRQVCSDAVNRLCFAGSETLLLTGSLGCELSLWNIASKERTRNFGSQGDSITSVASSAEGDVLASGCFVAAPSISLWSPESDEKRRPLRGHIATVWGLAILRDNRTLISASGDRTLRLWDITTGTERFRIDAVEANLRMAVSDDELTIAMAGRDGIVSLYRAASEAEVKASPGWWRLPADSR